MTTLTPTPLTPTPSATNATNATKRLHSEPTTPNALRQAALNAVA
jgi:hypothetical protein